MAGLAVAREEQHRLLILVLHARQPRLSQRGHVVLQLPRWMRIQVQADSVRRRLDLMFISAAAEERCHLLVVTRLQHPPLREVEDEDRIVWNVPPVDQFVHDVVVRLERKDMGHYLDREAGGLRKPLDLGQLAKIVKGVRPIARAVLDTKIDLGAHGLTEPVHLPELCQFLRLQVEVIPDPDPVASAVSLHSFCHAVLLAERPAQTVLAQEETRGIPGSHVSPD